jgi:hypothetical protein
VGESSFSFQITVKLIEKKVVAKRRKKQLSLDLDF